MDTRVPVNSLSRHIDPLFKDLVRISAEVIASGYYVLGPNVKAFEKEFAHYCGVAHCVSVANGTDAIELGLRSLDVGSGKVVGVVANAAMYGTSAVLACGAEPLFIDVDPVTHNLSPQALASQLGLRRIDVVIVTHLYGRLADMEALLALAAKYHFTILEDCAQAHGACDARGRKAGSFGQVASFSFYPTKNLGGLGDGGAVVTSDDVMEEKLLKLRQYGWSTKYRNEIAGGKNSRLDEIQAAFLRFMLPLLDGWNARRRAIANQYSTKIKNIKISVSEIQDANYVAHLYVIKTDQRDDLQSHLQTLGIDTDIHYPTPDYRQPLFEGRYQAIELLETEENSKRVLTLPCFPEMVDEEISRVIKACNDW